MPPSPVCRCTSSLCLPLYTRFTVGRHCSHAGCVTYERNLCAKRPHLPPYHPFHCWARILPPSPFHCWARKEVSLCPFLPGLYPEEDLPEGYSPWFYTRKRVSLRVLFPVLYPEEGLPEGYSKVFYARKRASLRGVLRVFYARKRASLGCF